MSTASIPASGSDVVVEDILLQLRSLSNQLASDEAIDVNGDVRQLKEHHKPDLIMDVLTPYLFQPPSPTPNNGLTGSEALALLIRLVSTDSATFLKPASRSVRRTALQLASASETPMVVPPDLLQTIVAQVTGTDVEVSTNATDTIVACCQKIGANLVETVFRAIVTAWKQALNSIESNRTVASTLSVRCASVVADLTLAMGDATTVALADEAGALSLLLDMLNDASDPLLQMSILDLLEKLATKQPVIHERGKWLFSTAVLEPLLTMAGGLDEEAKPDPILGGPALRVVAALCKIASRAGEPEAPSTNWFQVANAAEHILNRFHCALQKFDTNTELDRLAVVDAVSSFAMASPDALELVLTDPNTRHSWLFLGVAQSKLKGAILCSIAMALRHAYEPSSQSVELKRQLYVAAGTVNGRTQDTTDIVVSLAQSPFPEVRLGAYNLLAAAAAHVQTGSQILLQNSHFFTFLLGDRQQDLERTKEGLEAKYAIVQAVYNSEARGLLAQPIVQKLEKLLQQGPHHMDAQPLELATES